VKANKCPVKSHKLGAFGTFLENLALFKYFSTGSNQFLNKLRRQQPDNACTGALKKSQK
jgi:hypothetical protein